jgi:hypothetical protein
MKRIALVLAASLALGATAFAQSNFTAAVPQFLAFDLGAGFGYSISEDTNYPIGTDNVGGVINFGFKIAVLDNLGVGIDSLVTRKGATPATSVVFAGVRLTYNFIPQAGAAIGFGATNIGLATNATPPTAAGISLGIFGDLFQTRSAIGITTGLKLRLDYIAPTAAVGKGAIVFTPAFSFGL